MHSLIRLLCDARIGELESKLVMLASGLRYDNNLDKVTETPPNRCDFNGDNLLLLRQDCLACGFATVRD